MPFEIVLPRLGWTMESGSLNKWFKQDGEYVEAGEMLFAVEADKAVQEVEALESGILRISPDAPQPGQEVPVGTLLGYLVQPGEPIPLQVGSSRFHIADADRSAPDSARQEEFSAAVTVPGLTTSATQEVTPDAPGHRVSLKVITSPRARRVAAELGIDLTVVKGSGRNGRIVERDVIRAAAQMDFLDQSLAGESVAGVGKDTILESESGVQGEDGKGVIVQREATTIRESLFSVEGIGSSSHTRRVIARQMAKSAQTTAAVTLSTEVDATHLVEIREGFKKAPLPRDIVPTYNDILVLMASRVLQEHSNMNARLVNDRIELLPDINIGVAVDTERGLLVPVIRDVQSKGLAQIAAELQELATRVREGQSLPDDLAEGTFTITNLGMFEIDAFTPIINLPECAILGVGRIVEKPAVVNGLISVRQMIILSLTFDHRLNDGAPAARFLQRIKQFVEQPYLWLII